MFGINKSQNRKPEKYDKEKKYKDGFDDRKK
jgi:hypothetical protein